VIARSTDDPEVSVEEIEPITQQVVFETSWPDGFPREIEAVELLVDGVAVLDTCTPPCNTIVWDIASLPAGPHSVRIRVRDQQGLEAESSEVPLTISITRPTPQPPPTLTPAPTTTASTTTGTGAGSDDGTTPRTTPVAQTCEEMYSGLNRIVKCNEEYLAFGALAVALVALLLAIVVVRRPPQAVATVGRRIVDATQPFFLDRSKLPGGREVKATLEVLEGDASHTAPIELFGDNTRLGRDEELVQVAFENRAVSRLHARIKVEPDPRGGESFVLYDEGSTSGTYVNLQPVGIKGQRLHDNDTIHLGPVRMRFNVRAKEKEVLHEDTVGMRPIAPDEGPAEDEFATAPYQPFQPEQDIDDTQPFISRESRGPDAPSPSTQDEEDGLTTDPYVPMDFGDE
jgi:pSer/pThr/pTyr-binding forkhead associated (FHA) protein